MSTAGPPQAGGAGAGIGGFLTRKVFGMPLWLVGGIAIAGGVGLAIFLRRGNASGAGSALGQSGSGQANDPNIDPNTGVPYSIEEAIDPNTGLPAYYSQFGPGGGPGGGPGSGPTGPNQPYNPPEPQPPGQNPPLGPPPNPPPTPTPVPSGKRRGPPGPVPIQPVPPGHRPPGPMPPVPPGGRGHGRPGGPVPIQRVPPTGRGGSPQATPWWPIPHDVLSLSGGSSPGIPEAPDNEPPSWPWFNPWSGGPAQPFGPEGSPRARPGGVPFGPSIDQPVGPFGRPRGRPAGTPFDPYSGGIEERV